MCVLGIREGRTEGECVYSGDYERRKCREAARGKKKIEEEERERESDGGDDGDGEEKYWTSVRK